MAAGPPMRRRLARRMRLKQGRDFARVRRLGRRMPCGCFIANWQTLPGGSATRLGVITARSIGNAVERARARRLLREVFRLHQHDLACPVDFVLVAQRSIAGKQLGAVEEAFLGMLRKSGLMKTE